MAIISNGTTIADAGAFSASLGSLVHIKTITASDAATVSLVHGASSVVFNNTYPIYLIEYINVHPASESRFTFQVSTDTGSSYGIAITNTVLQAYHVDDAEYASLEYNGGHDHHQDTGFIKLSAQDVDDNNDDSMNGYIYIFDPSDTTFKKNYISNSYHNADNSAGDGHAWNNMDAGYFNTASAVDGIQFKFSSGNIASGTFKLYGIKDS